MVHCNSSIIKRILYLLMVVTLLASALTLNSSAGVPDTGILLDMESDNVEIENLNYKGMNSEYGGSYDTTVKKFGSRSAKFEMNKIYWGAVYETEFEPGTYMLAAWVKTDKLVNSQAFAFYARKKGTQTDFLAQRGTLPIETGTADWTLYEYEFKVPSKMEVTIGLQPFITGTGRGTFWLDNVFLGTKAAYENYLKTIPGTATTTKQDSTKATTTKPQTGSTTNTTEANQTTTVSDEPTTTIATDETTVAPTTENTTAKTEPVSEDETTSSNAWIWIVVVLSVIVVGFCVFYFLVLRKKLNKN